MMDIDRNASLQYALDLWADWLRADFGEIRKLWYPSRSAGLECRKSVTEDAFEDLEDEVRNADEMATEAKARVWRALCAEGCGN